MQMCDVFTRSIFDKSFITNIKKYLSDTTYQQQHLAGAGPIYNLESKLKDFYQKKFVVAFSNATTALQTLAIALDLNDLEVITSPINWGGAISPFLLNGSKLRFASYDPRTLSLSVEDLVNAKTSKSKAVLSVDYNGFSTDSKSIKQFCEKHNLIYINDSAQSLGAYRDGYPSGYFADIIVLSFSSYKSIFGGEGGAILTNKYEFYKKILWISQHPLRQKSVFGLNHYNEYAPINGRMNPLTAILLNHTFDLALKRLRKKQQIIFDIIQELVKDGLVISPYYIRQADESTYFKISLELNSSANIEMVNSFLKLKRYPFIAKEDTVRLIPFDPFFVKQFKGRYSITRSLSVLRKKESFTKRITLINSQIISQMDKDI